MLRDLETMMRNGEVKALMDKHAAEEVLKEREACAKLAADSFSGTGWDKEGVAAREIAARIRARNKIVK